MDEAGDGAEPDHDLGGLRKRFVIHHHAPAEPPGAEGLLEPPALGQQDKAFAEFRAPDSLDGRVQARQGRLKRSV